MVDYQMFMAERKSRQDKTSGGIDNAAADFQVELTRFGKGNEEFKKGTPQATNDVKNVTTSNSVNGHVHKNGNVSLTNNHAIELTLNGIENTGFSPSE